MRRAFALSFAALVAAFLAAAGALVPPADGGDRDGDLAALGEALFHDVDLSKNRTQACATCHMPDFGFVDRRETAAGLAASLGDDGASIGDRNAPAVAYAALSPAFHRREDGRYVGGQFLDGRAATLEAQAGGPPMNPVEMGMPDKASVVARLREKPDYVERFGALFGADVLADDEAAFAAMTAALAAFERTPAVSPFDSRYDRYLRGEETFTAEEELGRVLFFSSQFTNCSRCHKLQTVGGGAGEPFTNFEFRNIGVPANPTLAAANGRGRLDRGLAENPAVADPAAEAGKFKVPSLRNVAVTGPYMHNGVFKDLRTAVEFYNKYNSIAPRRQINPETGEPWGPPEVADNLSTVDLESGPALDDRRVDALVAFLKTLTDRRYEPLLDPAR